MDENKKDDNYVPLKELDQIEGEDGQQLDPIEQNQDEQESVEERDSSRETLEKAIIGEDDNQQDAILDE